jgi:hypothetical protein
MSHESTKGRELARKSAGLAASGLLALTLFGELNKASAATTSHNAVAAETQANQDPYSVQLDKKLAGIYGKIKSVVNHHPKARNARHTIQKDPSGPVFDRYTYATPISKTDKAAGYVQIVCIAEKGNDVPDGCEILYGVQDPLTPGQSYVVGSFLVRGAHNNYSLENILYDPNGNSREDYFNKDGNSYSHKFRLNQSPWQTNEVSKNKIQTPYNHFFQNFQLVLESHPSDTPPA